MKHEKWKWIMIIENEKWKMKKAAWKDASPRSLSFEGQSYAASATFFV